MVSLCSHDISGDVPADYEILKFLMFAWALTSPPPTLDPLASKSILHWVCLYPGSRTAMRVKRRYSTQTARSVEERLVKRKGRSLLPVTSVPASTTLTAINPHCDVYPGRWCRFILDWFYSACMCGSMMV